MEGVNPDMIYGYHCLCAQEGVCMQQIAIALARVNKNSSMPCQQVPGCQVNITFTISAVDVAKRKMVFKKGCCNGICNSDA